MTCWAIPPKLVEVTEETFEELSVCAMCGPEALYYYHKWAQMTRRKLLVDSNGDIHWLPSLNWPDGPS